MKLGTDVCQERNWTDVTRSTHIPVRVYPHRSWSECFHLASQGYKPREGPQRT